MLLNNVLLFHHSFFSGVVSPHYFSSVFFLIMSVGMEKPGVVEQVDLTPTLALGLGLPISQNSVGRVIPGVLEETSLRDQLRFLHLNGHQLSCLLKDSIPDYEKGELHIYCVQRLEWLQAQKARTLSGREAHHYAEKQQLLMLVLVAAAVV